MLDVRGGLVFFVSYQCSISASAQSHSSSLLRAAPIPFLCDSPALKSVSLASRLKAEQVRILICVNQQLISILEDLGGSNSEELHESLAIIPVI